MDNLINNIAYIDGQNLHMGTAKSDPEWHIDLAKFRIYLAQKYHVVRAYYYLGYVSKSCLHNSAMIGKKKGNVDSDIIFSAMKRLYEKDKFDKIVLVSGDGDYKMLVDFLIEQTKTQTFGAK